MAYWEQRGCGRTYFANPGAASPTIDQLLDDLDQVTDQLRDRFAVNRLVIMGHSWGSALGTLYAQRHPDKVSAYVGLGQFTAFRQAMAYATCLAVRRVPAGSQDSQILQDLGDKFLTAQSTTDLTVADYLRWQKLRERYTDFTGKRDMGWRLARLTAGSPDLNLADLRWLAGVRVGQLYERMPALIEYLLFGYDAFSAGLDFAMPVHLISGEYDLYAPVALSQEYFEALSAPNKSFTLVEGAGHRLYFENPDGFAQAVVSTLGLERELR
jgi:pimeloyl-ACP methyl ester carboxylesterase